MSTVGATFKVYVVAETGIHTFYVEGYSFVMGRSDKADIQIPGATTSRVHLKVWTRNGEVLIQDQKSKMGTFLNGQKLDPEEMYRCLPGDHIELGGFVGTIAVRLVAPPEVRNLESEGDPSYVNRLRTSSLAEHLTNWVKEKTFTAEDDERSPSLPPHALKAAEQHIVRQLQPFFDSAKAVAGNIEKQAQTSAENLIKQATAVHAQIKATAEARAKSELEKAQSQGEAFIQQARQLADNISQEAQRQADVAGAELMEAHRAAAEKEAERIQREAQESGERRAREIIAQAEQEAAKLESRVVTRAEAKASDIVAAAENEKKQLELFSAGLREKIAAAQNTLQGLEQNRQRFYDEIETKRLAAEDAVKMQAQIHRQKAEADAQMILRRAENDVKALQRAKEVEIERMMEEATARQSRLDEEAARKRQAADLEASRKRQTIEQEIAKLMAQRDVRLQEVKDIEAEKERLLDKAQKTADAQMERARQSAEAQIEKARREAEAITEKSRLEAEAVVERARKSAESQARSIVENAENQARAAIERAEKQTQELAQNAELVRREAEAEYNELVRRTRAAEGKLEKVEDDLRAMRAQAEQAHRDLATVKVKLEVAEKEYQDGQQSHLAELKAITAERDQRRAEMNTMAEEMELLRNERAETEEYVRNATLQAERLTRESEEKQMQAETLARKTEKDATDLKERIQAEYQEKLREMDREIALIKVKTMEEARTEAEAFKKEFTEKLRVQAREVERLLNAEVVQKITEILPGLNEANTKILSRAVSKVVTMVMNGELPSLQEKLKSSEGFDPEAAERTRRYWRRTLMATAAAGVVATLVFIFEAELKELAGRAAASLIDEKSGADRYAEKIQKMREEQGVFAPPQSPDFKSSYTDNVLYTSGFSEMELNEDHQKEWVLQLNQFLVQDLRLSENSVAPVVAKETNAVKKLKELRDKINPKFVNEGVERMRQAETEFMTDLEGLLGGKKNVDRFVRFKKDFFEAKRQPAQQ